MILKVFIRQNDLGIVLNDSSFFFIVLYRFSVKHICPGFAPGAFLLENTAESVRKVCRHFPDTFKCHIISFRFG